MSAPTPCQINVADEYMKARLAQHGPEMENQIEHALSFLSQDAALKVTLPSTAFPFTPETTVYGVQGGKTIREYMSANPPAGKWNEASVEEGVVIIRGTVTKLFLSLHGKAVFTFSGTDTISNIEFQVSITKE